jgi:hypothetical protein
MLSWAGIEATDGVLEKLLDMVKSDEFLELTDTREIIRYLEDRYKRIFNSAQACRKRLPHQPPAFI